MPEKRFRGPRLVLLLALCLSGTVHAQQRVLDRYIAEGLQSNLALAQQEITLEQSLRALDEARGLFLPALHLEARYSRSDGGRVIEIPVGDLLNPVYGTLNDLLRAQGQAPGFPTLANEGIPLLRDREQETKLRLTQPLFQPRLLYNYRMQRSLAASQEAAVEAFRRRLVRDIKVAYFTYLKTERAVEIYQATMQLVEENQRTSERLFRAHMVTEDAVPRARAEVLALEQQTAEARKDGDLARAYFNFLLNRPLDAPIEGQALDGERPPEPDAALLIRTSLDTAPDVGLADLQALALSRREELRQMDRAMQASEAAVGLARSAYLPAVTFVLDVGIQGRAYGFTGEHPYYTGSVVLQWNLFNGLQDRARLERARLETRKLRAQREALENRLRLEVQEAYDNVMVVQRSLEVAEERVRAARQGFRLVARKYEEGLEPQVTLFDARTTLTGAELNLNITHADLLIRLAELEYAAALMHFDRQSR